MSDTNNRRPHKYAQGDMVVYAGIVFAVKNDGGQWSRLPGAKNPWLPIYDLCPLTRQGKPDMRKWKSPRGTAWLNAIPESKLKPVHKMEIDRSE